MNFDTIPSIQQHGILFEFIGLNYRTDMSVLNETDEVYKQKDKLHELQYILINYQKTMKFNINKSITLVISKEPITEHSEPYGNFYLCNAKARQNKLHDFSITIVEGRNIIYMYFINQWVVVCINTTNIPTKQSLQELYDLHSKYLMLNNL